MKLLITLSLQLASEGERHTDHCTRSRLRLSRQSDWYIYSMLGFNSPHLLQTLHHTPVSPLWLPTFPALKHSALYAHLATCPLCLLHLKLTRQVLGVPHSSGEPALDQLLVGIPTRRQRLCKGSQAKGEVIGQVVPDCWLVAVAHHLKHRCKTCSGTYLYVTE